MEIFRNKDKEIVAQRATQALSEALQRHERDPVLLLLSGGSWLGILHQVESGTFGEHVTIGMTDERFSRDPAVNNFAQLEQTEFYRRAKEKGVHYINTKIQEGEKIEELAARFENELRDWKENNPQGRVIITQGIGSDGHTAGIMPYPENPELFSQLFDDSAKWVIGYNVDSARGGTVPPQPYLRRVTITLPFLRDMVDHSVVYAVGEEKSEALTRVLVDEGHIAAIPARIIREMKYVILFIDL